MGQMVLPRLIELVHVENAGNGNEREDTRKEQVMPVFGFRIDDDAGYNVREQTEP